MVDSQPAIALLVWSAALALAWMAGEVLHRWHVPRISTYGLIGFALAPTQLGILPAATGPVTVLPDLAFGLILFEFGYRINLHWLRTNRWLAATGVRSSRVKKLITSQPRMLVWRGQMLEGDMRRERITAAEVESAVRGAGLSSLEQAQAVVLETDGSLHVMESLEAGCSAMGEVTKRPD